MKKTLLVALLSISSLGFADIVAKPDGSVTCTGGCTVIISGGTTTFCQGKICMEIQKPKPDNK
jgi:hypothetical protein